MSTPSLPEDRAWDNSSGAGDAGGPVVVAVTASSILSSIVTTQHCDARRRYPLSHVAAEVYVLLVLTKHWFVPI